MSLFGERVRLAGQRCSFAVLHILFGVCVVWGLGGCGAVRQAAAPAAADATVSSSSVRFAPTTVGTAAVASTLTLSNTGGSPLQLRGEDLSDTTDFSFRTDCAATLAPGARCSLTILFAPQSAAELTGSLTITDDSGGIAGAQQMVSLSGTGTMTALPQAALTPTSLIFGQTVQHVPSPAQILTLSNTGTAALAIGSVALSDPADFSLGSSTCGASLAPNATCAVSVVFLPQAAGPVQGSLTVTSNSGGVEGTQQTVSLSGTGLPAPMPQASLSATTLSFAGTVLNTSSAPQGVRLSNTGSADLAIGGIALSDTTDFKVASSCGATLAAGSTCTLLITFAPQSTGPLQSSLVVTDNSGLVAGTVQQTVALSGTGLPVPLAKATLTPASSSFGSVNTGSTSPAQSFVLTNSGAAALTIGGVTLSDAKNFVLTNGCGTSLAANASCTLGVVFQPQAAGTQSATLTVSDNSDGSSGAQQTANLTGVGVAPPASHAILTANALRFPDTMVSQSATPQTVTLTNTGSLPLALRAVALSDQDDFSLSSDCPSSLASAASCTLTVGFQPKSVASFQAVLTLTDNSDSAGGPAMAGAQQMVSLTGNGTAFDAPRAMAAPSALTFAQTVTNSSAPAQVVSLTNTGTQTLTVASVALGGTAAAAFAVTDGNCVGALAPGSSCTESITYNPRLENASDVAILTFTDNALGHTGSLQTVQLNGSALAEVDSVENFGDSITCSFYATPHDGTGEVWSTNGYASLLDTFLGVPAQNWCRQGDTAADLSRLWVPYHSTPSSTGNQLFTLMVGTNDAYRYGVPPVALQTYTAEVGAAVAWLAMPNTDKVLANAITQRVGTWYQDVDFGLLSSDAGASLSFSVNQAVAGRQLYVVYHVWDLPYGQAGKASIAVDGTVQATVEESVNSGAYLPTLNGTYDTYLVQTVPLGAVGPHTITFQSVGPSGSEIGLLWAGVAQQDYRTVDGASLVLLGYVPNSPSGNQTFAADQYSLQLISLISTLVADGLNVRGVNTSRVMDPNTDFVDLVHPNNAGHAKLAAAFEQAR